MRSPKTQISLRIRTVWSESSLSAWSNVASQAIKNMPSEDSDQPAQMRRLIWIFTGRNVRRYVFWRCGSFFYNVINIGIVWHLLDFSSWRTPDILGFRKYLYVVSIVKQTRVFQESVFIFIYLNYRLWSIIMIWRKRFKGDNNAWIKINNTQWKPNNIRTTAFERSVVLKTPGDIKHWAVSLLICLLMNRLKTISATCACTGVIFAFKGSLFLRNCLSLLQLVFSVVRRS